MRNPRNTLWYLAAPTTATSLLGLQVFSISWLYDVPNVLVCYLMV
jgi:hypothetical protein